MKYQDKQLKTTTTPGITVIIFGDKEKRGGDAATREYIRNGEQERERMAALLRGEQPPQRIRKKKEGK